MAPREHFLNIMHYGDFDRMPVWHWTGWNSGGSIHNYCVFDRTLVVLRHGTHGTSRGTAICASRDAARQPPHAGLFLGSGLSPVSQPGRGGMRFSTALQWIIRTG